MIVGGGQQLELREVAEDADVEETVVEPRVAPMIDVRELGGLLQRAGLALPVADLDRTIVRYADAVGLIHEIHELGRLAGSAEAECNANRCRVKCSRSRS